MNERSESTIITRLGDVLYWAFSGLAVLLAFSQAYAFFSNAQMSNGDRVFFLVIAFCLWLVGRAARYILAGR